MNIKAVSVKCFELFALDGTSLGLFKVANPWVWSLHFSVIKANVDQVLREAA